MKSRQRLLRLFAVLAIFGLLAASCGNDDDDAGGGSGDPVPGVTDDTVKIGLIWSATGPASGLFVDLNDGFNAYIDRINAEGGVHGRQIEIVEKDDASSPDGNLTTTQQLIQRDNVFALVNNSSFTFGGFQFAVDEGVPLLGGGYDGQQWCDPANTLLVSVSGNCAPFAQYEHQGEFMKAQGATKVAAIGYGTSPSSAAAAERFCEFAAPSVGMECVLSDLSLPFGSVDVQPVVLAMRQAGADAALLPMIQTSNFAILETARQIGYTDLKVPVLSTGYGREILQSPEAVAAGQGAYITTAYAPVEADTEATRQMVADLNTVGWEGQPNFAIYQGYINAALLVQGLEAAGENLTRDSFMSGLRSSGTFDQAGLGCQAYDISLERMGEPQPSGCAWFVQLVGSEFVPVPADGTPWVGPYVEGSAGVR